MSSLQCSWVKVAELQDCTEIRIPVIGVKGGRGPCLMLNSTSHGQEIVGAEVIRRIVREELPRRKLRGSLLAIPIANPLAYQSCTYASLQDNINLNRVFPGKPNGSTTERITAEVWKVASEADCLIDLHCSPAPCLLYSIVRPHFAKNKRTADKAMDMAHASGVTVIVPSVKHEVMLRSATLHEVGMSTGIPSLTIEFPTYRRIDEKSAQQGVHILLNIMKMLDMIDGRPEPPRRVRVLKGPLDRLDVLADRGGLVHFEMEVGDKVSKGAVIARIRDPFGNERQVLKSPLTGYVISYNLNDNQACLSGESVASIAFPKVSGS